MTGTNHALTGALIATAIGNPIVFVPAAIGSHFVLDMLPHFGEKYGQRKKLTKIVWTADAGLLVGGLILLVATQNWLIALGSFAALSPDLAWIFRFVFIEKWGTLPPGNLNRLNSFHANIQKLESREGVFVEVLWLIGAAYLCSQYVL
jgi:hypothetical protein